MIRVGTCSWTEKTLVKSGEFYPKGVNTAEARLQFYADNFDTVEVDSTYYAIPDMRNAALWAHRTPENFLFHIKAYGALTGHSIDPRTLPGLILNLLPRRAQSEAQIQVKDRTILRAIAEEFIRVLAPLRESGKLGLIVFQFPPWFQYRTQNFDYILQCKELMADLPVAVEFRHGSWFTAGNLNPVLLFLRENSLTYVTADEPQYGNLSTVPFMPELTTDTAYFRFHGRNRDNWFRKGIETSLRFAYEYSDDELSAFIPPVIDLQGKARQIFLMFNNCRGGSATRNALRMKRMLQVRAEK